MPYLAPYRQSGFSLIEIMIVIAIIAVLVAAALPSYQKYTKRAHYLEVIHAAAPLKLAVTECYTIENSLRPCQSGHYSIPRAAGPFTNTLIQSTRVLSGGVIHIIPNATFGIQSTEDYLLTPSESPLGLQWRASGGGVTAGYTH